MDGTVTNQTNLPTAPSAQAESPLVAAMRAARTRARVAQMSGAVADNPLAEFREKLVAEMGPEVWAALQRRDDGFHCVLGFCMQGLSPALSFIVYLAGNRMAMGSGLVLAKKDAGWVVIADGLASVVRYKDDAVPIGDRILLAIDEMLGQCGVTLEAPG